MCSQTDVDVHNLTNHIADLNSSEMKGSNRATVGLLHHTPCDRSTKLILDSQLSEVLKMQLEEKPPSTMSSSV